MGGSSKPKPPKPPKPPKLEKPPTPEPQPAMGEGSEVAEQRRRMSAAAVGRQSTILTDPENDAPANVKKKTLLGG